VAYNFFYTFVGLFVSKPNQLAYLTSINILSLLSFLSVVW